jgi:hypothetical protein
VKRGIEASTTLTVAYEQVRPVMAEDPSGVVADRVSLEDRSERRLRSELGVDLGAGGAIHQAVEIELGSVRSTGDGTTIPLRWQARGRDRLFPVFDGHVRATPDGPGATELVVAGTYVVPLGPVGRFGDGLIGRRLARQSLTTFLEEVARRIDTEVHRRAASVSWHPAPYPISLREQSAEPQLR